MEIDGYFAAEWPRYLEMKLGCLKEYAGPQPELLTIIGRVPARNRELYSLDFWRELENVTCYIRR